MQRPQQAIESAEVPGKPTTVRLDEGLKSDAQRAADARGVPLAEFIRQALVHYCAWCAAAERSGESDAKHT